MVDDKTRGTRAAAGEPTADGDIAGLTTKPASLAPSATAPTAAEETIVPSWGPSSFVSLPDPGYQIGAMIGHGGMGEVVVAQDLRIGREVAVKRIRSDMPSPDSVLRFLREARIQARLDHPAIVPVYELGTDEKGKPYFTMKRLTGVTLARRLASDGPVQPLLRAFADVCLAIELAHSRGVVHRDVKPSNIMLGDFGEVYVLDWGVARVLTETKRTTAPTAAVGEDESTTAGAILGTPGYMAPEQVRGEEASTKADVYALGAILFEILAGEPLHPRGEAALGSTLTTPQVAPARRASDRAIPPELDAVCFDALAERAADRPTARELAERVQAYLDGDRDHERRRVLAAEQLASAHDALASNAPDARASAMRRAGRALALDPESKDAAALVSRLVLEPPAPDRLPPELTAYIAREDRAFEISRSKQAIVTYLSLLLLGLMIPFLEVKSWSMLIGFYALMGLGALSSWRASRARISIAVAFTMTGAVVLVFSRIAGPFILTPIVICAAVMQLAAIRRANERAWLVLGWTFVSTMLPFVLEWTGILHPSYAVTNGVLLSTSDMFAMSHVIDETVVVGANLIVLLVAALVAVYLNRSRILAQRQVQVQAWHLRQLLPSTSTIER